MARLPDWQANLADAIKARMETPYHIVDFNCLLWGCEVATVVNGSDYYAPFRNKTASSETSAAITFRSISKLQNTTQFLEQRLGSRISLAMAKMGDLLVAPDMPVEHNVVTSLLFGPPIGVCYGAVSFFVGFDGLVKVQTLELGSEAYGFYC